jgi:hypothetical protein
MGAVLHSDNLLELNAMRRIDRAPIDTADIAGPLVRPEMTCANGAPSAALASGLSTPCSARLFTGTREAPVCLPRPAEPSIGQ